MPASGAGRMQLALLCSLVSLWVSKLPGAFGKFQHQPYQLDQCCFSSMHTCCCWLSE